MSRSGKESSSLYSPRTLPIRRLIALRLLESEIHAKRPNKGKPYRIFREILSRRFNWIRTHNRQQFGVSLNRFNSAPKHRDFCEPYSYKYSVPRIHLHTSTYAIIDCGTHVVVIILSIMVFVFLQNGQH